MTDKKEITGMILSNGKSKRTGTHNGLIKRNNRPFVEPLINALDVSVCYIVDVTNSREDDVFGLIRAEDEKNNTVPVAGIYSGLKADHSTFNLVMRFRVPLIKLDIGTPNIYTSEPLKTNQQ
jgi:molybdopterin-guanine dinucleotide biosynthesis protein A